MTGSNTREWLADANCVGLPPDYFDTAEKGIVPDSTERRGKTRAENSSIHMAKKVCANCRVRLLCLAEALEWESELGRRETPKYTLRGGLKGSTRRGIIDDPEIDVTQLVAELRMVHSIHVNTDDEGILD